MTIVGPAFRLPAIAALLVLAAGDSAPAGSLAVGGVFLTVLAVLAAGFYAGTESGFYTMNLLRVRCRAEEGNRQARRLQSLAANPQRFVTMTLVGVNVSVYAATLLCTRFALHYVSPRHAELLVTLVLSAVLLVTSEIVPKTVFQLRSDPLMARVSGLLAISDGLFGPAVHVLRGISWLLGRLLGIKPRPSKEALTPRRVSFLLTDVSSGTEMTQYQKTLSRNILHLKSIPIRRVMTPLDRVAALPLDAPPDRIMETIRAGVYSRYPVYDGDRARIVGIVHIMDILCRTDPTPPPLGQLFKPVRALPAELSVAEALYRLQSRHEAMGLVQGPEGKPIGIVSVKDLVEQVVGELKVW